MELCGEFQNLQSFANSYWRSEDTNLSSKLYVNCQKCSRMWFHIFIALDVFSSTEAEQQCQSTRKSIKVREKLAQDLGEMVHLDLMKIMVQKTFVN